MFQGDHILDVQRCDDAAQQEVQNRLYGEFLPVSWNFITDHFEDILSLSI